MSKMKKIVIVGRANVGKSTLFNRLSSSVKALTLDLAGVTRDFIKDIVTWKDSTFELVDSGGLILKKTEDIIEQKIREKGLALIEEADLILFVCDGTTGVLQEDKEIARILHKSKKEIVLVINKIDTKLANEMQYEFVQLGFKKIVTLSAQHGTNIIDVLDAITDFIGHTTNTDEEKLKYKVVLLGKPNVGKSSLLNLMLEKERAIVSDIPGTTREPISEKIKFFKENILITDTAGVRRKRAVTEEIENLMVKSTLASVKDTDIVLLLIDGSSSQISDQELKLAFYVFEQGKALIILFNKEDLITPVNKADLEYSLSPYKYFLKKIDSLNISCKTEKNVGKILPLIDKVWQRNTQEFSAIELTQLFKDAIHHKPLFHNSMPLMIFNAKQIKTAPITIMLTVNEPNWFGESQLSFFENTLRSKYDLVSVPVIFVMRKRNQ